MEFDREHTSEHNDGRFRKTILIDEKITHALSVIDASLKFMAREFIRDSDDHSFLTTVRVWQRTRRRLAVRGRRRRRVRRREGLRRDGAWVGNESDSLAECAAD